MQSTALVSLFRTMVFTGIAASLITLAALPLVAQNSVPASAVQAAKMPQYAGRLARPVSRPASPPKPTVARQGQRRGPGQGGGTIYENGPINGTTDAWTINIGFAVSDSFTVGSCGQPPCITGFSFGAWLLPGDVLQSVEVSITSQPFGGTTYFDGIVTLTQDGCTTNQYAYDVCTETANLSVGSLSGPFWVNLQNASVTNGDPVYWDENSGVGCQSDGCPSQAQNNDVGTIPSESFSVLGQSDGPVCFGSQENLQIIYNFTQEQGQTYPQSGVTIDRAGNLYGVTAYGGNNGAGFAYKLTHLGGWLLDPLFNFFGGDTGGQPTGVIVGPNGSIYGGAGGGILNCGVGTQDCGIVFNLRPKPTPCMTALCGWNENVPYRFSGESDGSGTINVSASDPQGNLYGTTATGGAFGAGTVFELTPSCGGWTKAILYSFTGGSDGSGPTQVLVGNDGNLYGVASGGYGIVFQLTPSGGQWTESVLHQGGTPAYLGQDSAGNLYGIETDNYPYGTIFTLQKKTSGWAFSEYLIGGNQFEYDILNNLATDAAGNVYGTGLVFEVDHGVQGSFIFKARYSGIGPSGWHYELLTGIGGRYLPAGGSLALDTSGNLYGTTSTCGTHNSGTVWQFSP